VLHAARQHRASVTVRAGTNTLLGLDPARIAEIPGLLAAARPAHAPPPGWDGRAGEGAAEVAAARLER